MGRVRNWDPRVYAEVLHRLESFDQTAAHIAQAVEMSTLQVAQFKSFLDNNPGKMPTNRVMPTQELLDSVKESLTASVPNEPPTRGPGRPRKDKPTLTAEETAALSAEIDGCLDLAKQVAALYHMSPGKFLWLVTTRCAQA